MWASEGNRTYDGPLSDNLKSQHAGGVVDFLDVLPSLDSMGPNALRFVAIPSFGTSEYAFAAYLPGDADNALAVLIVRSKMYPNRKHERHFTMPAHDYGGLVVDIDNLTDDWVSTDSDLCLDGTPVAFERIRGERITSGDGNCSNHYRHLSLIVLEALRRFAPGDDLPTESDWHRFEDEGE